MTRAAQWLALVSLVIVAVGCAAAPSQPVPRPRQEQAVTVSGVVVWEVPGRPGCVHLRVDSGRVFRLTGPAVEQARPRTVRPEPQRVVVTGVANSSGATVCGPYPALVASELTEFDSE